MNKKAALVYNWSLTILTIFILAWTYLQFNSKYNQYSPIGIKQLMLFNTYSKGESTLFYIDQSARYSLQQTVYELAKSGGISEIEIGDTEIPVKSDCGKFDDAAVWFEIVKNEDGKTIENRCFDENSVNIHLEYLFNKYLNQYLLAYPGNIPIDNYNYEIKDAVEIIGKAIEPLKFEIFDDAKKAKEEFKGGLGGRFGGSGASGEFDGNILIDFSKSSICAKGSSCKLTDEAAELLEKAQKIAEEKDVSLEVYSAYRSFERQKQIWEGQTAERYAQRYPSEAVRRKYVCDPGDNSAQSQKSCPHLSGKVVDIRLKGKVMDAKNWQLLHNIMTEAGWVRYSNEPWHFECCGTDRYARAKAAGVTAIV